MGSAVSDRGTPLLLQRAAFWALFPLVAAQGLWVSRRAPRFAAAAGPRSGAVGDGPTLRLLALGDSIIDGVGAETIEQALVGRFAEALARRMRTTVEWHAVGRTGAKSSRVRAELLKRMPRDEFDMILVSVGVNDVTGLARSRTWTREVGALVDELRARSPRAVVLMAGLPPLDGFPLLPQPLRYVFGLRARTFDRLLERVVALRDRCFHVPTEFVPSPEKFSADGYHPSIETYRDWGEMLADWVAARGWDVQSARG